MHSFSTSRQPTYVSKSRYLWWRYTWGVPGDYVDGLLADWARERPDLDPAPFAVVTRIRRAAALLEGAVDAALAPLGLTWGALDVLASLRRAGPPYRRAPPPPPTPPPPA